jgi:hypothetical protein
MGFPAAYMTLQGKLKTFDAIGGSGQIVHPHFCPYCGSWVIGKSNPAFIGALLGSLDEPSALVPTFGQFPITLNHGCP